MQYCIKIQYLQDHCILITVVGQISCTQHLLKASFMQVVTSNQILCCSYCTAEECQAPALAVRFHITGWCFGFWHQYTWCSVIVWLVDWWQLTL